MSEANNIHIPPTPRPRSIKLDTAKDARKFLARLINKTYRDEIDASKAGRLGYLVGILIKSIEINELEERIASLESRFGKTK